MNPIVFFLPRPGYTAGKPKLAASNEDDDKEDDADDDRDDDDDDATALGAFVGDVCVFVFFVFCCSSSCCFSIYRITVVLGMYVHINSLFASDTRAKEVSL